MRIELDDKTHTYFVNGDIASVSVTELLHKHGLSPSYDGVSKTVLKAKSSKGKELHKEIENCLNTSNYEPKTAYGLQFQAWAKENLDCGVAEQLIGYNKDGLIIGGCIDILAIKKDGTRIIADNKFTSSFNREYVSWQVSLYDYFLRINDEKINGNGIKWLGASEFYCFWYNKDKMELKPLEKVPDAEIEELLRCENNGEIYKRKELVIENELAEAVEKWENRLVEIEREKAEVEQFVKDLRSQLVEAMQRQNVISYTSDTLSITLVPETTRTSVDSTKLRRDYPLVYKEVVKQTKVKPYVKVKVKEDEL